MKICPNCNTELYDDAVFCNACGTQFVANQQQPNPQFTPQFTQPQYQSQGGVGTPPPPQPNAVPQYDIYDHTAEFDPKDISDNKVISMLVYLMGPVGILIALLASNTSPYASFHVRQALKITVVSILASIISVIFCWTIIVPIAYGILMIALVVIKLICFFQICSGKAKEPAIIRSLGFLR